ncbi:MAG: dihydrodipicolinate synthase family protein [Rhizobiales bacterium]|nr:dihydrodipicolinate synthase family protein [Hyphomicrobiales bacterium]
MTESSFAGVLVPALTPFTPALEPDRAAWLAHCRWLLDEGADGLAIFGTTSEANSLGIDERMELLDYVVGEGIDPALLMPGTGTCALADTVKLTSHAVSRGVGGVLLLPPFYYKGVGDDGLFAAVSEVIERVGSAALKVYLYHIPPVAQVGYSVSLIERLVSAYPQTVVGIKDSSGDWSNTKAVLDALPQIAVFPGSEIFLLDGLRAGGAGCITASGNVNPAGIRAVYTNWREENADRLQARITEIRKTIQAFPAVPALKAITAAFTGSSDWSITRPPLEALDEATARQLLDALSAIGFSMADNRDCHAA